MLLQHTDLKEIRANAALWERSISVLYRSHQITARSESLEAAKKRAEELGVRVLLAGDEPQSQHMRALSALAICECAANCVRHADGTELYAVSYTHLYAVKWRSSVLGLPGDARRLSRRAHPRSGNHCAVDKGDDLRTGAPVSYTHLEVSQLEPSAAVCCSSASADF